MEKITKEMILESELSLLLQDFSEKRITIDQLIDTYFSLLNLVL